MKKDAKELYEKLVVEAFKWEHGDEFSHEEIKKKMLKEENIDHRKYLQFMCRLRNDLLYNRKKYLVNIKGYGYRIASPRVQAVEETLKKSNEALRKYDRAIDISTNTDSSKMNELDLVLAGLTQEKLIKVKSFMVLNSPSLSDALIKETKDRMTYKQGKEKPLLMS